MLHANDFGLSSQVSTICLIRVEGDILLLHGASKAGQLLKLVGLSQGTETQLVVVDTRDRASAGLNSLDC